MISSIIAEKSKKVQKKGIISKRKKYLFLEEKRYYF